MAKKPTKTNEESTNDEPTRVEDIEGFKPIGFKLPVNFPFYLVELPSVVYEIEEEVEEEIEEDEPEKKTIEEQNYHIFNNLISAIKEIKKFLKEHIISAEVIQTDIKIISFLKETGNKYGINQIPWSTIALELIKN